MYWSKWHQWSTEAKVLAVYCFNSLYLLEWGGTILLAIWERRHHFIGNFGEEAPFYWLFERGGTILLGKLGRKLMEFLLFMSKTMLEVIWSFILWPMASGGLVILIIRLFYWCGLSIKARSIFMFTRHEWNIRLFASAFLFNLIWI